MPRFLPLLALLFLAFTGSALASPWTVLQRPIELETAGGTLHGTLLRPKSEAPVPVALLLAGSGPTDRNGNNPMGGRNDSLKKLAELLARNGIASVRYDKRGIAASRAAGPDERQLSVDLYVADAVAWGRTLKADPRFSRLVLIGHSEGALIASLAAPDAGADALVSIAGSARPIDQVLQEQLQRRLPSPLLARSNEILASLRAGHQVPGVPKPLLVLYRPSVQPYLISLFAKDPAAAFAAVRVPALIVQGTHDSQVEVADARALQAIRPDAELAIIPGMDHVLRITPADARDPLATYNSPGLPLARELGERLIAFIERLPSSDGKSGR
ncbi:alpha/beta hydrolase [Pseudomonas tohonis]|uniref:alpha/beta hydrolase n=1 Tax=Pseudomonas tohonis TaxID=2725477 RepID=UPI001F189A59|nr:alpha/beta fold hydrolase [Pseudomonas tohonis]